MATIVYFKTHYTRGNAMYFLMYFSLIFAKLR